MRREGKLGRRMSVRIESKCEPHISHDSLNWRLGMTNLADTLDGRFAQSGPVGSLHCVPSFHRREFCAPSLSPNPGSSTNAVMGGERVLALRASQELKADSRGVSPLPAWDCGLLRWCEFGERVARRVETLAILAGL